MQCQHMTALLYFSCLLAAPLAAQTTIGGNPCNSASVNGPYSISITGRQVTSSGNFANVFQANGTATFNGLSAVSISLVTDTNQTVATPATWSGTYTMQANCVGTLNITSGGNATFSLVLFANGVNFLMTGSDATYSYSGNGNVQPTNCTASLFSGVYSLNASGFNFSGTAVNGAAALTGLMQFDGQGHVTVNQTLSPSNANAATLTGTYTLSSNCLGSATLSDSKGGTYTMTFSTEDVVTPAAPLYSSTIFVMLAQSSKFIVSGAAHAIYGQPTSVLIPANFAELIGGRS